MKSRDYKREIDRCNKYIICNVPDVVDFEAGVPVRESFKVPPIGIYYETWTGRKKPLNDSFLKYCASYMSNDIWRKKDLNFLFENLISILHGEVENWRLVGVDSGYYLSTTLWIACAEGRGNWFFINLEPQRKTLRLCFESQNTAGEIVQHHYRLRK